MATVSTVEKPKQSTLTAMDRCDSCGAQAYFEVTMPHGEGKLTGLLFCKHHFDKGKDKLTEIAVSIIDESYRLEEIA